MESIAFLGLSLQAWITIATVVSVIIVLMRTRIPPLVVFLAALTVLVTFGIVTEAEGMAGFGSESVVVHGAFFVVMAGLRGG